MHHLLERQLKRTLGLRDAQELEQLVASLETEGITLPEPARRICVGLKDLLGRIENTYQQHDRDLELRIRSLNLSTEELVQANERLRQEAESQARTVLSLRTTANELLASQGKEAIGPEAIDLAKLSGLMAELVADRRRAQRELEQQKFALDEHAIVSITDTQGIIHYANDKFCEVSGYSRQELLGANHRIVKSGHHPPAYFREMWETITAGRVWHGEVCNRSKGGESYWVAATIVPILDEAAQPEGYIAIRTDITRQKAMEAALAEQQRFLKDLTDSMGEGVYALDERGLCLFINPEAERLLGWTHQELLGQRLHDCIHHTAADGHPVAAADCVIMHTTASGDSFRSESEVFIRKDGTQFPISIIAVPQRLGDRVIGQVAVFTDISERRAIEAELRESREQLHLALDASQMGLWDWNVAQDHTFFSDRWLGMLGYERGELPETGGCWSALVHPDDLAGAREVYRKHAEGELPAYKVEFRIRHKDGSWRWFFSSGQVTGRNGRGGVTRLSGIDMDITERKQAEQEIQRSKVRYDELTARIPVGVYTYTLCPDAPLAFDYVSDRFCQLLGVDRVATLRDAAVAYSGIHRDDLPRLRETLATSAEELRPLHWEGRVKVRGEFRHFSIESAPSRISQGVSRWNGILVDITEQKQAELAVREARDVAIAASQAKSEFLANMSHEIRTPLNAVIGLSHLALEACQGERERGYLNQIQSSGKSLLWIINDILDLSKIEAGRMTVDRQAFQLNELLSQVVAVVGQQAAGKGLQLLVSVQPGLPAELVGDAPRLKQVLTNLAGNAVKFTQQGEVELRAERVDSEKEGPQLQLSVRDTGIGITPEQATRLFQPFSQADSSTTRTYGGTGLGLAICKRLAELMDGSIRVESTPGCGSVFFIQVPLELPDEASSSELEPMALSTPVLVIEPHSATRAALLEMLTGYGLKGIGVDSLEAGQSAVAEGTFGLLLVDLGLPTLGVRALVADLESRASGSKLIFLQPYDRDLALEGITAPVLQKPILPNALVAALQAVLAAAPGPHAASVLPLPGSLPKNLEGRRVLLAEDDRVNQLVVREILTRNGLVVTCVGNGREAIACVNQEPFDLVLMDVQMPDLDGYEATREIRARGQHPDLPIIALTAHALQEVREHCLAVGMNDHLTKPIVPDRLLEVILRWVQPQEQADISVQGLAQAAELGIRMEPLLARGDLQALDLAQELVGLLSRGPLRGLAKDLENRLQGFDFDRAAALLMELQARIKEGPHG